MCRQVMTAGSAVELTEALERHGTHPCVGGGWGIDALLSRQTLDLWLPATELELSFRAFAGRGLDRILPRSGDRPWNFVLHDGAQRCVDLHLYESLSDGSIHYGRAIDGYHFPAAALEGRGMIAGIRVRCEAPEWALRWRTGYAIRDDDRHDVSLLCTTFGLDLPNAYR